MSFNADALNAPTQKGHSWGDYLQLCATVVIGLNVVYMGLQMQITVEHLKDQEDKPPLWLWVGDLAFALFFVAEMTTRLILEGREFFIGPKKLWNLFDSVVIGCHVVEVVFSSNPFGQSRWSYLRIFRIFRILRA